MFKEIFERFILIKYFNKFDNFNKKKFAIFFQLTIILNITLIILLNL